MTTPILLPPHPAGHARCDQQQLPRDVMVRLAAVARQVRDIRQDHALDGELSLRLDDVTADLDRVIQGICDETTLHLTSSRVLVIPA